MFNLLQINKLSKAFGRQVVLDEVSFNVGEKQKISVVGRNGAGKSTLFNIITGMDQADSGEVLIFDRTTLGYLKQEDNFQPDDTALDYLMRESGKEEWRCAKLAARFDISYEQLYLKIEELSGGYQMRVKLTLMLLADPNLILLDEPTNYLDLSTLFLLEKFLKSYKGSYLIISHDRRFIMNTCDEVLEIENGKVYHYPNTLNSYFEFKRGQRESAEKFNKKQNTKKKQLQAFVDRFGAKASKATQAKSKEKQIQRLETVAVRKTLPNVQIKVLPTRLMGGFCWRINNLAVGYDEKVVAKNIELYVEKGDHIAILGDNGQGKSTFLKTIIDEIPALAGTIKTAQNLKVAYYSQHVTTKLNPKDTVSSYLTGCADHGYSLEEIYRMAGNFLFRDDDINKPISVLSGGEKARLCLAGILLNRYDALLLDEPTNHLDFETSEILASALAKSNLTILFISHDRTFVGALAQKILEVKNGTIKLFSGSFEDYMDYLKNSTSPDDDGVKEKVVEIKNNQEYKRKVFDQSLIVKKELAKIEKELTQLKTEQAKIFKKFEKNPTAPNIELNLKLKEITGQIEKLEEEWLKVGDEK
jgi:ATP-binding cassette subfamily F protein 3